MGKFKKVMLERINSLEDYLGLKFCPSDTNEYAEHVAGDWNRIKNIEDRLDKLEGKKK